MRKKMMRQETTPVPNIFLTFSFSDEEMVILKETIINYKEFLDDEVKDYHRQHGMDKSKEDINGDFYYAIDFFEQIVKNFETEDNDRDKDCFFRMHVYFLEYLLCIVEIARDMACDGCQEYLEDFEVLDSIFSKLLSSYSKYYSSVFYYFSRKRYPPSERIALLRLALTKI